MLVANALGVCLRVQYLAWRVNTTQDCKLRLIDFVPGKHAPIKRRYACRAISLSPTARPDVVEIARDTGWEV